MSQGVKRKRPNHSPRARKRAPPVNGASGVIQRGPAVRSESLKWKEIEVAKYLDDAEGFYGLEELSDVEVIRDSDGKDVLFRPVLKFEDVANGADDGHDGEEWSGFGDDESADRKQDGHSHVIQISNDPGKGTAAAISEKKRLVRGGKEAADQLSDGAGFDLLDNDVNEPEIDMSAWKGLELSPHMLYALSTLKFSAPTQIQRTAIPSINSGMDVIGKAVTGSGKTLAFGIPIIESWLELRGSNQMGLIALILAPTRELAHQILKHLATVCEGLDRYPRLVTVTGGLSVLKQQRQLENANIVVGTPGRLWDVISESNDLLAKLKNIQYLVVDEADRLLSDGHFKEVDDILDALDREVINEDEAGEQRESKPKRQVLVFSATFHKGLQQKLASKQKKRSDKDSNLLSDKQSMEYLMHKLPFQHGQKPVFVDANPESQMAENLSETILECKAMEKDLYLYTFLLQDQHQRKRLTQTTNDKSVADGTARILVFTNSVSAVKRLVALLQNLDLPATSIAPLHSNMPQKSRLRSLERFSGTHPKVTGATTSVLIATDVAARGLDIRAITTIVHYHVPRTADTYVHRSGRTARVGKSGSSILLCSPDETASVTKLIAKVHSQAKTAREASNIIGRMYLPGDLLRQVENRVQLAQSLVESYRSTERVKSEDNWLRNAAQELGVDYDSEEFENAGKQGRRGRGGGGERKQKRIAEQENRQTKLAEWKARLREDLQKRIDFGDWIGINMKYLAGGALDVDQLLAERAET